MMMQSEETYSTKEQLRMDVLQRLYLDCTARAVKTGHGQNINQQRSRALDGPEMCLSSPWALR